MLSRSLAIGKDLIENGEKDGDRIIDAIKAEIEKEPLARIDYVEMVKWDTIEIHHSVDCDVLVAMAVYIGKTRLIDNFIWEAK